MNGCYDYGWNLRTQNERAWRRVAAYEQAQRLFNTHRTQDEKSQYGGEVLLIDENQDGKLTLSELEDSLKGIDYKLEISSYLVSESYEESVQLELHIDKIPFEYIEKLYDEKKLKGDKRK